jgi:Arc/MetJ-type ribon-helix-helix transcriptional regulator
MVRTQVQLTEEQAALIKQLAAERDVSMSEIIRIGMTDFLTASGAITRAERIRRALAVTGRFRSDKTDVSERHDAYLSEAYQS